METNTPLIYFVNLSPNQYMANFPAFIIKDNPEGMENLNGILMATTNLTQNLDKAFERRFLYKIELHKPDSQTRCLIWRDKIPGLTDSDYKTLSNRFNLSGEQIENISRKYILSQILSGEKLNLSQIMDLCNEEFLDKTTQKRKIGYLA